MRTIGIGVIERGRWQDNFDSCARRTGDGRDHRLGATGLAFALVGAARGKPGVPYLARDWGDDPVRKVAELEESGPV